MLLLLRPDTRVYCCCFAVQVQYPGAERVMMSDLRNLKVLAWFLQKFELDFDILSSLRELSKQIKGEFDFRWAFLCASSSPWRFVCCVTIYMIRQNFCLAAYFHQQAQHFTAQSLLPLRSVDVAELSRPTTSSRRNPPSAIGSLARLCLHGSHGSPPVCSRRHIPRTFGAWFG